MFKYRKLFKARAGCLRGVAVWVHRCLWCLVLMVPMVWGLRDLVCVVLGGRPVASVCGYAINLGSAGKCPVASVCGHGINLGDAGVPHV